MFNLLVTSGPSHVFALALPDPALDMMRQLDNVTVHGVDVRDTAALTGILTGLDVDILVNNAGIIGDLKPIQQSDTAIADALIDVNLRAAVHATLALLPGMVQRNLGHIVFTGSIAATRPTANTAVYSATKAALNAFADGLRIDLHGAAVRVTVLAPGRVTRLWGQSRSRRRHNRAEPNAAPDRGRHHGFARYEGLPGGPGK